MREKAREETMSGYLAIRLLRGLDDDFRRATQPKDPI